jgi:sec-independent protein translocase protein TatB
MFDISWTEFLLIGVVALIVIGPKELPGVMRTLGQWTRKVRGMATDFQNQFQEAMREAEMSDLKKQVDDMAQGVTQFDPLKSVRDDVESMGKDVERSLGSTLESAATPAAGEVPLLQAQPEPPASPPEAAVTPAQPETVAAMETIGAGAETGTAEAAGKTAQADDAGRTG